MENVAKQPFTTHGNFGCEWPLTSEIMEKNVMLPHIANNVLF